jgi:hypothetical protein
MRFHIQAAGPREELLVCPQGRWPAGGPDWLIRHSERFDPAFTTPMISDPAGNRYEFVRHVPTAPLSGLHWYLYRNLRSPSRHP